MAGNVITVRYSEFQRYDISKDAEVIRFMATTVNGSYWAEVPIDGSSGMRRDREAFKSKVVELVRQGLYPCEVHLG